MSIPVIECDVETIEQERHDRIAELCEDSGENWSEGHQPGTFGCHELLDRTSMLADMVDQWICSHPACVQNAEWYRLAAQAAESLQQLYQQVGAAHVAEEPDNAT